MSSIQQLFSRCETQDEAEDADADTVRILLADDEEGVRAIVTNVLNRQGWAVTQARDGLSAIDLVEQEREDYDLIILDVDMPCLNGYQTYQRIHARRPDLPVLFISGAPDAVVWDVLAREGLARLSKPFSIPSLVSHVRGLLTHTA